MNQCNSYPSITVTVSVSGSATSPQINAVAVTTEQVESTAANNTATDSTAIVPAVVAAVVDHPIPTLSDWALIGIGLLLAALAAGRLRRPVAREAVRTAAFSLRRLTR